MEIWFYEKDGTQQGPVTEQTLLGLRDTDEITDTTLVWKEGLGDWKPLASRFPRETGKILPPAIPARPAPPALVPPFTPSEVTLRPDSKLRIFSSLKRAWALMLSDFWPIVGITTLGSLLVSVAGQLYVTLLFLILPVMAGLYYYLILKMRGRPAGIDNLFDGFRRNFADLAIINLVVSIPAILVLLGATAAFIVGTMSQPVETWVVAALVVTGLISIAFFNWIGLISALAMMITIDNGTPAKESLGLAFRATMRHWWKAILFYAVTMTLALSGVIVLYFGVFITSAWATIAAVYLYDDLFERTPKR